jgi:hypothetical protein
MVFIGWGIGAVKTAIEPGQAQEVAIVAYKPVVHVGLVLAL